MDSGLRIRGHSQDAFRGTNKQFEGYGVYRQRERASGVSETQTLSTAAHRPWPGRQQAGATARPCPASLHHPSLEKTGSQWLLLALLWFPGIQAASEGESVRGSAFPFQQVLNLALWGDPPSQYSVLLPAGQPSGRTKVVGDR